MPDQLNRAFGRGLEVIGDGGVEFAHAIILAGLREGLGKAHRGGVLVHLADALDLDRDLAGSAVKRWRIVRIGGVPQAAQLVLLQEARHAEHLEQAVLVVTFVIGLAVHDVVEEQPFAHGLGLGHARRLDLDDPARHAGVLVHHHHESFGLFQGQDGKGCTNATSRDHQPQCPDDEAEPFAAFSFKKEFAFENRSLFRHTVCHGIPRN
ncbi:hypothetical protein QWZ10_25455 [Paracoccus cavernae]|uniref:Uncharacterized protein n=1 Tax=Paracoccus cavernae TaxID=1571207 RepID=A0ABT8DD11_9RHOB|nr:hypothetical protein [Paracoccus cavernae]